MVPAHSHKVSRVSWYSGYRLVTLTFAYGILTLFDWSFQCHSASLGKSIIRSEPRSARTPVWALSVSLAATPEIILYFLFLRLLRCFSSPGSLPRAMDLREDDRSFSGRVSPFRNPRIKAHLRLPAAYRSLSRLSSAPGAKASALRPCCLTSFAPANGSWPSAFAPSVALLPVGS